MKKYIGETKAVTNTATVYLDIIRILASQMVVLGHGVRFNGIFPYMGPPSFPYIQKMAVVIFFFLSGFLITTSVIKKTRIREFSFLEYFCERFARIYSAVIPCLLLILIFDFFFQILMPDTYGYYESFNIKTLLGNLFMLQNYPHLFNIASFGSARPLWTLAIEWWIYMLFGLLFLFPQKNLNQIVVKLVGLGICGAIPWYYLDGRGNGLTFVWMWGSIFSYLYFTFGHKLKIKNAVLIVLGVTFTYITFAKVMRTMNAYEFKFGYLVSISMGIWFFYFNTKQSNFNKHILRLIEVFAGYSFTLYIIHYSLMDFLRYYFVGHNPYVVFSFSVILVNVAAYYVAKISEHKTKVVLNFLKTKLFNETILSASKST
jgi:peptidoglycan/LPS O-acetylase OafA/YrhL